jgi:P4 family phage/plasmid primase-like protien
MTRLFDFLERCPATKASGYTHTSIAAPKRAYNVPSILYDDFLKAYCAELEAAPDRPLHLTEKPTRCFPVVVDLDFRFSPDDGVERRFDRDFVSSFVALYAQEILKVLDLDKDGRQYVKANVLSRPGPYVDKGVLKDGLHIVFDNASLSNTVQRLVRERVLAKLPPLLASGLDGALLNSAAEVLDEHATMNNWQMYGSCKPGRAPYLVTRVMRARLVDGRVSIVDDVDLPASDSRKWTDFVWPFSLRRENVRSRITVEATELAGAMEHADFLQRKSAIASEYPNEMSVAERAVTVSDVADDETVRAAEAYAGMLTAARAESYDSWIRVGWALRNIDHRLLSAWMTFSNKSSKYDGQECTKLWHHMKREANGLTFGSLRRWAQLDDPDAFHAQATESRRETVIEALSGTHHDLAKLVHCMYKDEFVCSELGSKTFFQFKDHKWVKLEHAHALRARISTAVYDEIKNTVAQFAAASGEGGGGGDGEDKKKDGTRRVLESLKDANQKDKIMKECAELFYHKHFEQDLDEKTHLIGFNNGIFDLERNQFREGRPEDMVSMCTGVDYQLVEGDDQLTREIDDFFGKVFPDAELREYAVGRLASFISGDVQREEFYIFTGSGSNGKSKTIELFEASFGGYCCKLPTSLVTQRRAAAGTPSGELARTRGRRFCVLQEPGESERLNVGIVKELSGGDRIQCRALYSEPIEFRPQFNMVMTCNTLPAVPDNDGGTWRRIKVVEFSSKFVAEPSAPNEFEMDPELNAKFRRWKRPFMMNLVARFIADRGVKVVEPAQVSAITQRYREEQDILAAFVKESFQEAAGCETSVKDVHALYKDWCKINMSKSTRPDQMMSMVTKLKATDMREPVGGSDVPLLRHVYKNWVPLDD